MPATMASVPGAMDDSKANSMDTFPGVKVICYPPAVWCETRQNRTQGPQ